MYLPPERIRALLVALLATGLALPASAASAPRVYGRIRNALVYTDGERDGSNWDVQSNTSRFGLKGSERLASGVRLLYRMEWEVDTTSGTNLGAGLETRLGYAGVRSDWGTLTIGRQWTPYYIAVDKSDVWQLYGVNTQYLGPLRLGDMLLYRTPEYIGFSGRLGLVMASEDQAPNLGRDGVDIWNASLDFNNGPLSVGTSYLDYRGRGTENRELWGASARYRRSGLTLIAQYEYEWIQGQDDNNEWSLVAEYRLGNNLLRAMYSDRESDGSRSYNRALGVQHYFDRRVSLYAEFQDSRIHKERRYGSGLRIDF